MDVTLDTMKASIGSLLLLWSNIERSVRSEVVRAHGSLPRDAHGVAAALDSWKSTLVNTERDSSLRPLLAHVLRSQLQKPLEIRNGICHGLIGIAAETWQNPGYLEWELNGRTDSIQWHELQRLLAWLSKVPHAIVLLSNSGSPGIGNRMTDNGENRAWWHAEFSLDVPDQ